MFFTENRKLKREVNVISDENNSLRERIDDKISEIAVLSKTHVKMAGELKALTAEATKIEGERDELKKMVREQTEADLLINALKGLGIIKKPAKYDAFERQASLQAQRDQAAGMNSGLSQFGDLARGFFG